MTQMGASLSSATPDRICGSAGPRLTHEQAAKAAPPARGPAGQTLCAAHADGLSVTIYESGNHPTVDVVSLFAHHVQLLGTSRARWATQPIR